MRTRIARSIVAVTALVIVVLGVPFAVVVQRFYESRAVVELQRSAAEAITELTLPLDAAEIADAATEPDAPADFSVYDPDGVRLYGNGPDRLPTTDVDRAVVVPPDTAGEQLVVVSPVTDRRTEDVVGSVLVMRPRSEVSAEARRAWALMALAALGGITLAVAIARREAARLATPITDLAALAGQLGSGRFAAAAPTGTAELDTLAEALTASDRRLSELLAREREFSANASHQLRTPLTALRLSLDRGDLDAASTEVDRLAETVDHLLAFARGSMPTAEAADIEQLVRDAEERWKPVFDGAGRGLAVAVAADLGAGRVRPSSLRQVLDDVLDNSLRHGAGATRLDARPTPGGVVVSISDEGPGIPVGREDTVFDRHEGVGSGSGLALARTLTEADGGRLLLTDPGHAEFRIVLLADRRDQP